MENASKALLMAGGILIAIITISVFSYMFSRISRLTEETSEDTNETEIADYNKSFEAYNKKLMYGTDVISVYNKAIDNNERYGATSGSEYYVEIYVCVKKSGGSYVTFSNYLKSRGYVDASGNPDSSKLTAESSYDADSSVVQYGPGAEGVTNGEKWIFKVAPFQCTSVKYNSYGRISAMYFKIYY